MGCLGLFNIIYCIRFDGLGTASLGRRYCGGIRDVKIKVEVSCKFAFFYLIKLYYILISSLRMNTTASFRKLTIIRLE